LFLVRGPKRYGLTQSTQSAFRVVSDGDNKTYNTVHSIETCRSLWILTGQAIMASMGKECSIRRFVVQQYNSIFFLHISFLLFSKNMVGCWIVLAGLRPRTWRNGSDICSIDIITRNFTSKGSIIGKEKIPLYCFPSGL
jgi:hypothetical protein